MWKSWLSLLWHTIKSISLKLTIKLPNMKNTVTSLSLISIILLLLWSCAPAVKVTYDYDKTADFTKFKTYSFYGWQKGSEQIIGELNKRRIEQAAAAEFNKRGLQFVESGGDCVVSLFVVVDQEKGVTAYTDYYSASPYYYRPGWGWGAGYGTATTTYHEYDYYTGTLVIDVFDASSKQLVWQGVGSKTIEEDASNREKNLNEAVAQIMYNFPIKPVEVKK